MKLKQQIESAINDFNNPDLFEAGINLFKTLGYNTYRQSRLDNPTFDGFYNDFIGGNDKIPDVEKFKKKALTSDWQNIEMLFQLTESEMNTQGTLFSAGKVDNTIIEAYLFFAIELKEIAYSRTKLSDITRYLNRVFPMPVMVLFKYGGYLTLSVIKRRLHKRDESRDVLKKVTLIKDIKIEDPHRAHIEILFDLSLEELRKKHAVTNFVELDKAWQKTLDSSELNKKFYKELAIWYYWAVKNTEFPDDAEKNREIRNASSIIRLLTRLIFVWFIKEKELVPGKLFNRSKLDDILNYKDKNESSFYKAVLQNLFFATLNQEQNKRAFRKNGQNYNVTNLYRYKKLFKIDKIKILELFKNIPFLNGGLFECLDKPHPTKKGPHGGDIIIRIDGFSDRDDNILKVPDYLFFSSKGEDVDLNEIFGTRNKNYKAIGLITILDKYKFTIAENTPIEEEIALDPELLGKVFENLLASYNPETKTTARKQTGSFYTPREIVDYMVDESLKASLSNLVSKKIDGVSEEDIQTGLEILFAYTEKEHAFTETEVSKVIEAVSELKILDPACGSGAFPMGILHKLVFILSKLDKHNERWKELQKQRALKETEAAYNLGNKDERHQRLAEIEKAFDFNTSDYGRKLFLIENSIYGVDIQPIAVQIAKLRFFISLIVDQDVDKTKENLGILPLPNLETKFVAANTLIGVDKPDQGNFADLKTKDLENELLIIRHKHFNAKTQKTKRKYREEDKRIRHEISQALKKSGWPSDTAEMLADWDPYDQNQFASFFDMEWMFGARDGFDIVIGNPPYIKEYTDKKAFNGFREQSSYYQGKMDIWYGFACIGIDLLKITGNLCFIATNNWVTNAGASKFRKKVIEETKINKLLDFNNYMIFENADIQTMIMIFNKALNIDKYRFDYRKLQGDNLANNNVNDLFLKNKTENTLFYTPQIIKKNHLNTLLVFNDPKIDDVLQKITVKDYFLLNTNEVANGIHSHHDFVNKRMQIVLGKDFSVRDGIFALSKTEKNLLNLTNIEKNILKPYYTTNELNKYYGDKNNSYWLIYTSSKFKKPENIKPYPNIKKHLDKFKDIITSDNRPYGLHRARKEAFFTGEKIIALRKCAKEPIFTYTDFDCYVSATFYVIKTEKINNKFLAGFLNSKLCAFWLRYKGKMQGNNYQVDKEPLINIPIPQISPQSQLPFISLVDTILAKKEKSEDTTALEAEIDARVAHLYNLTEEEYSLILKETNCPDPFRVAALNVYRDIARGKIK
ncbi:MAG: N-6 DNA methylase [Deltaproteobacteria bacterium]|nr:N-6 DNA methylase [Deltaproteobacteria bacterium]